MCRRRLLAMGPCVGCLSHECIRSDPRRHFPFPSHDIGVSQSTLPGSGSILGDIPRHEDQLISIHQSHFASVTGPVARFCRQIAGHGFICAAPSSYHEFTGPEALSYNAEDTDKGNDWKKGKVILALQAARMQFCRP